MNSKTMTLLSKLFCLILLSFYAPGICQANDKVEVIGSVRTVTGSTKTTGGTIAAGARKVEFIFSSDFAGTITATSGSITYNGATDSAKTYVDQTGGLQPKLTYTVSAGSVRIIETR